MTIMIVNNVETQNLQVKSLDEYFIPIVYLKASYSAVYSSLHVLACIISMYISNSTH